MSRWGPNSGVPPTLSEISDAEPIIKNVEIWLNNYVKIAKSQLFLLTNVLKTQ